MAANTFAKVSTPLGDELVLRSLTGTEALGRPFKYELELYGKDIDVSLADMLGQSMTVQIELGEGKYRYIDGIVSRFACVGGAGRHVHYRATLRPWLWLMSRHLDCRIFQNITAPEVIKQVFRLHDFSRFDESLSRSYREWEYLVQYRESSFQFVTRLMEQEGIYYYFKHAAGQHTLYLTDSYSGHEVQAGYEEIPYFPPYPGESRERDHIDGWSVVHEIQPGRFALNEFDFKKPKASLLSALNAPNNKGRFEVYDYPGEYELIGDGEVYTRVRMEEASSQYELIEAAGNARGLTAGSLFTLEDHPRADQNREYLITSATCELDVGAHESTEQTEPGPSFRATLQVLRSKTPYRLPRETATPRIAGPQTATVVGAAGDEIHTDRFGRVKLKFHWDRAPERNETSSCYVRVSQAWAGPGFGAMHLPRVGDEVIVEFLEGDPDRPIVTGRVYNAMNMPPYELPANKTQSGIKSRSTKGGTQDNFNELRFEDKKGEEQLYLQAERNMDTLVKADQTLTVIGNRAKLVEKDESAEIGGDRTHVVAGHDVLEVGKTVLIEVADEIVLRTGNASITLRKNGDIALEGKDIQIAGTSKIDANATESVTVTSARINLN